MEEKNLPQLNLKPQKQKKKKQFKRQQKKLVI